jgi:hypothetical protein
MVRKVLHQSASRRIAPRSGMGRRVAVGRASAGPAAAHRRSLCPSPASQHRHHRSTGAHRAGRCRRAVGRHARRVDVADAAPKGFLSTDSNQPCTTAGDQVPLGPLLLGQRRRRFEPRCAQRRHPARHRCHHAKPDSSDRERRRVPRFHAVQERAGENGRRRPRGRPRAASRSPAAPAAWPTIRRTTLTRSAPSAMRIPISSRIRVVFPSLRYAAMEKSLLRFKGSGVQGFRGSGSKVHKENSQPPTPTALSADRQESVLGVGGWRLGVDVFRPFGAHFSLRVDV